LQQIACEKCGLKNRDYHQGAAAGIWPQQHCAGWWTLPNTKQTFQDRVWCLFLMGDAHPTGFFLTGITTDQLFCNSEK
jgi:hypothetical protein